MKALQVAYAILCLLAFMLSWFALVSVNGARYSFERFEARLGRLEADSRLLLESRVNETRYLDRLESRISPPAVERLPAPAPEPDKYGSLLEKLGRTMDRVRILEEALDNRPTPAPPEPKSDTPIPTPSNLWLGSGETPPPSKPEPMIGPAGNGRTRQEVLDSIPRGDPLYNFRAVEYDAISLSDTEWEETYGTSPKLREEAPK
jgi:hypothetical protein